MPAIVPFIPLIASGVSAVGGALSNKSKSTTSPTMDPAFAPLQAMILKSVQQRMAQNPDLSGYQANGLANVNQSYDAVKQAQDNALTARGLSTSPVAGAVDARRENARGGDLAGFMNTLPMLRRQMQDQDLANATSVLGLGRGSSTTASTGGGAAGAATNLAQMLGYFAGQGAFGNTGVAGGRPVNPNGLPTYFPNDTNGWG